MAVTVCKTHHFRTENLPLKLLAIVCAEVMFEIGGADDALWVCSRLDGRTIAGSAGRGAACGWLRQDIRGKGIRRKNRSRRTHQAYQAPRPRRRVNRNPVRPFGAIDPRFARYP